MCFKMGIYDNMDKVFKQYDFGFAIFRLSRQEMRVKQLNFNRLIEKGLVHDNQYNLAEAKFTFEQGRYCIVPFCLQKGEAIFLYLDYFTNCSAQALECRFKSQKKILESKLTVDSGMAVPRLLKDLTLKDLAAKTQYSIEIVKDILIP